ncbi:hypothetical protein HUU05_11390 [candidate division KSB1 bacterium]|nr:hypothetical protein [candidate division KSB1 bacterium]
MIAIIACFALMLALQLVTPFWWWIMAVPFVYGVWKSRSAWDSARVGMISAASLWLLTSVYQWWFGGREIAERMGAMLGVPQGGLMILITALLAALTAGAVGSSGYALQKVWKRE